MTSPLMRPVMNPAAGFGAPAFGGGAPMGSPMGVGGPQGANGLNGLNGQNPFQPPQDAQKPQDGQDGQKIDAKEIIQALLAALLEKAKGGQNGQGAPSSGGGGGPSGGGGSAPAAGGGGCKGGSCGGGGGGGPVEGQPTLDSSAQPEDEEGAGVDDEAQTRAKLKEAIERLRAQNGTDPVNETQKNKDTTGPASKTDGVSGPKGASERSTPSGVTGPSKTAVTSSYNAQPQQPRFRITA